MRRSLLLQLGLVLILCVSAAASEPPSAQPPPAAPPVIDEGGRVENPPEQLDLTYRFEDGQADKYQVQIMNRGSYRLLNQKNEEKLDTVTEMFFLQSVKAVEDGLYRVQWALLSGIVRMPDIGQSSITLPEITYTMDNRGAIKKVSGLEKLALLPGKPQQKTLATIFGQLSFQGFPKTSLKVGDGWTRDYNVPVDESTKVAVKVNYKLIGYEKCDGYNCARIEAKYDYPVSFELTDKTLGKLKLEGKESGSIITRFAFVEGKMIRSEGDITTDAKVTKADGSGDAFVKLQLNTVGRLLPPQPKTGNAGG